MRILSRAGDMWPQALSPRGQWWPQREITAGHAPACRTQASWVGCALHSRLPVRLVMNAAVSMGGPRRGACSVDVCTVFL